MFTTIHLYTATHAIITGDGRYHTGQPGFKLWDPRGTWRTALDSPDTYCLVQIYCYPFYMVVQVLLFPVLEQGISAIVLLNSMGQQPVTEHKAADEDGEHIDEDVSARHSRAHHPEAVEQNALHRTICDQCVCLLYRDKVLVMICINPKRSLQRKSHNRQPIRVN